MTFNTPMTFNKHLHVRNTNISTDKIKFPLTQNSIRQFKAFRGLLRWHVLQHVVFPTSSTTHLLQQVEYLHLNNSCFSTHILSTIIENDQLRGSNTKHF